MKLIGEHEGERHNITIDRDGFKVVATVDDCEYVLDASEPEAGLHSLISNGIVFDCRVEPDHAHRGGFDVRVGTRSYAIRLFDPKRLLSGLGLAHHGSGTIEIKAPMPGKVVRILLAEGDPVAEGQGVLVVEAMKMQNEMKSPVAGKLLKLNVREGTTVNGGDVIAVIE